MSFEAGIENNYVASMTLKIVYGKRLIAGLQL